MDIPVYYPTLEECQNLRKYCDLKQYESPLGICKLKLPPDVNLQSLSLEAIGQLRCKRPVYQTQFHQKGAGWFRLGLRSQKTRSVAEVWATSRPPLPSSAEFWDTFGQFKPLYGSDSDGTAFRPDSPNLITLFPNAIQSLKPLKGINTPFLYLATAGSAFGWHSEDLEMFSVNYMHIGAPKVWHTFSRVDNAKFQQLMAQHYPADARACPEFIRHKVYLAAPQVLEAAGIKVAMIEQHPGELIVTFPQGMHMGFNKGPGVCEAVNFITASWVPIGRAAGFCECRAGTLRLNFTDLVFQAEDEVFTLHQRYCVCADGQWDGQQPMIQCDRCAQWYHYACVVLPLDYTDHHSTYSCPTCTPACPALSI